MIELIGLFGLAAFVFASLVVGCRILLLALRTGQLPEVTIGLSLVLAGGVGAGLSIAPLFFPGMDPMQAYVVAQVSSAASHTGFAFLFLFVWRVFRPVEFWAAMLFSLSTALLISGGAGIALDLEMGQGLAGREAPGGRWFWISLATRFVVYSWAAIESFRYYRLLKRRQHLGLANATVVSRFLYWSVCTAAVVCIWINLAIQRLALADSGYQSWSNLVSALLGFVVAGSLWLAFFPRKERIATPVKGPHAPMDVGR